MSNIGRAFEHKPPSAGGAGACYRPATLADALELLAGFADESPARQLRPILLAGGTDIYPAHVGRAPAGPVIDLGRLRELNEIAVVTEAGQRWLRIGALTRWACLRDRRHPALGGAAFDALAMAAAEIGGRQIQSRATLAGNLCNASPAADGVPALLALQASVRLRRASGTRLLPLTQFIVGPRRTALAADELLEAVYLPLEAFDDTHSVFLKLGHRRFLVISAVMVAVSLTWRGDTQRQLSVCRIGVGACGPVATRLGALEDRLLGLDARQLQAFASQPLSPTWLADLQPIDDLRGTAGFRLQAAQICVQRALLALAGAPAQSVAHLSLEPPQ